MEGRSASSRDDEQKQGDGLTVVSARRNSLPSAIHIEPSSTPLELSNPFAPLAVADVKQPAQDFLSQTMRDIWKKAQAHPISEKVTPAFEAIIADVKAKNRYVHADRSADDDGIKRSFEHILNDATLNIAISLMHLDKARANDEITESKTDKPRKKSAPWVIHYKAALSALMYDSAKALNSLVFLGDISKKIYNFETDKIVHIQDQKMEDEDATVDPVHFFKNKKRCIDSERRAIERFDVDSQIMLMVCCGFKDPLGEQKLRTTIDKYLGLFNWLYQQQILEQQEQLKKLEADQGISDEQRQQRKQQLLAREFAKLTVANINIHLLPFDGVDVALEDIKEVDKRKQSEWKEQNESWLEQDYAGIQITRFADFKKTLYYQLAEFLMSTYLISRRERIIHKKLIATDINTYLSKLANGDSIIFESSEAKTKPNNKSQKVQVFREHMDEIKEQGDGDKLRPTQLRTENITIPSPSPTTSSSPDTSTTTTPLLSSSLGLTKTSSSPSPGILLLKSPPPPPLFSLQQDDQRPGEEDNDISADATPSGSPVASPGPDPAFQNMFFFFKNTSKEEVGMDHFMNFTSLWSRQLKKEQRQKKHSPVNDISDSKQQPTEESSTRRGFRMGNGSDSD